MKRVVLDHHLDEKANVYRLLVGLVEEREVAVLDEHGEPVHLPDEPVMRQALEEHTVQPSGDPEDPLKLPYTTMVPKVDERGNRVLEPVVGEDGELVMGPGPLMTERVRLLHDSDEVLFSADDQQWEGLEPKEVARRQVAAVRASLEEAERLNEAVRRSVAERTALPGIGQEL